MRGHRGSRLADGTAWLVADIEHGDFLCYWYAGPNEVRLVEQSRAPSAAHAVSWGRHRTDSVRIRMTDGRTYWAGTAPRREGLRHTWSAIKATEMARPSPIPDLRLGALAPGHTDELVGAGTRGTSC